MPSSRPKFAVDEMLGTMARWLRIMGYDAAYEKDRDDEEIINAAMAQGRILITRDKELAARMEKSGLYIDSDRLEEQLRQVWQEYGLRLDQDMTRCTVCNGELEPMKEENAKDKVPEGVFLLNHEFFQCRSCDKIYWRGTHWLNINKRLSALDPNQSL
jgi:uncharacterized protein with PIN domain